MTYQIVEEQTDFVEEQIQLFNQKFRNTDWYPNNWKPIEDFLRSLASTLIEKEREFTKEEQEIIKQDMEGLLRIAQMTRTVKISGEPTPGMIAWMKEDQRQDKVREQIIKKIDSRTKLQEMR